MGKCKYIEIKEWLRKEACKPESRKKMATVREIQRRFAVSQAPVSRALQELEREGVILCRQGAGITANSDTGIDVAMTPEFQEKGDIIFAFSDYISEYLWRMQHVLGQCARQDRYNLIYCRVSKSDAFRSLPDLAAVRKTLKGIIIASTADRVKTDILKQLSELNCPVVLLDNEFKYELPDNVHSFSADMIDRGEKIMKYLFEHGHHRIGIVRNEPLTDHFGYFTDGLRKCLRKPEFSGCHLHFFSGTIKSWSNSLDAAQTITLDNLAQIRSDGVTALVYQSAAGAFAALQTFAENGIRVPEDISVVGISDCQFARYSVPAMTVFSTALEKMLQDAFKLVTGNVSDGCFQERVRYYPHTLIERKSVKDIRTLNL